MPDSDKVHAGLSARYQKSYKQLCEGYMSPEELTYNILRPLIKDIRDYGDGPLNLIKQVGERLQEKTSVPMFKLLIDYNVESQNIENLAQKTPGNPRGIALAEKACEAVLQAVQRGEMDQICVHQIIEKYIEIVYDTNFIQPMSLVEQHYNNIDQVTVVQRLEYIQTYLNQNIVNIAEQIRQKDGVKLLRIPRRSYSDAPIDIHNDDLLSIGM